MGKQAEMVGSRMRQATSAVVGICKKGAIHNLGTKVRLWDALVVSILKYGMQVYGMADVSRYRVLKTVFLKRVLGLPLAASNKLVLMECGQVDIELECAKAAIGFRLRLLRLEKSRVSRFLSDYVIMQDVGWGKEVRLCCERFGCPGLTRSDDLSSWEEGAYRLLTNMHDSMLQGMRTDVCSSSSVCFYMGLKEDFLPMGYLLGNLSYRDKCLILRMRTNTLPLNCRPSRGKEEWGCGLCDVSTVEDMAHFILDCPVYAAIRDKYIDGITLGEFLGLRIPIGRIIGYLREALKKREVYLGF